MDFGSLCRRLVMSDVETIAYKLKDKDNLWSIVKKAGFPPKDWGKILGADYNKKLAGDIKRDKRSPDLVYPGEVFYLPKHNSKDIQKQRDKVKKQRILIGEGLGDFAKFTAALARLKAIKGKEIKSKKEKLAALKKEHKRLDDAIYEGNKPGPMEGPGEKGRQLWTRWYLRRSFSVNKMKEEIEKIEKNIEGTSADYDKAIKRLEGHANGELKKLKGVTNELKASEAELSKMIKDPY